MSGKVKRRLVSICRRAFVSSGDSDVRPKSSATMRTDYAWLARAMTPDGFKRVVGDLEERELQRYMARTRSREDAERERDPTIKPPSVAEASLAGSSYAFDIKQNVVDHYAVTAGCQPLNEQHNRYLQLEPYDRTRVTAPDPDTPPSNAQRYLNANWVREKYGGKWWIATQAPLPHTSHAFLSIITQPVAVMQRPADMPATRVRTVVQLTQNMEGGRRKAHPYFPEVVGQTIIIPPEPGCAAAPLKVSLVRSEHIERANCVKSIISVKPVEQSPATSQAQHSKDDAPIVFQHLLYAAWPDHGVPEAQDRASLQEFARLVDDANRDTSLSPQPSDDPDPPIIVGCSAGIGRTGSFIALSSLLRSLGVLRAPARSTPPSLVPPPSPLGPLPETCKDDMVAQEVDALREQRPGMVQRDEQILLIYELLAYALDSQGVDS
ncbi:protein-tyrosine phosphatase-like protein [Schizophyllum amplum]|uniref:Protein-tyrosine phosphatase-like protein n=1 Tax=Schizophyllum amplum TaxID=97359 RepID=A0A550C9X1_9AGAR|nr:protein-tyrosine phosphatase-like protein [Auriculariopsis ampla]